MKKFTISCEIGGQRVPLTICIERTFEGVNPIEQQAAWLWRERGGTIAAEVTDAFEKLAEISRENGVSFEELCTYALGTSAAGPDPAASADDTP